MGGHNYRIDKDEDANEYVDDSYVIPFVLSENMQNNRLASAAVRRGRSRGESDPLRDVLMRDADAFRVSIQVGSSGAEGPVASVSRKIARARELALVTDTKRADILLHLHEVQTPGSVVADVLDPSGQPYGPTHRAKQPAWVPLRDDGEEDALIDTLSILARNDRVLEVAGTHGEAMPAVQVVAYGFGLLSGNPGAILNAWSDGCSSFSAGEELAFDNGRGVARAAANGELIGFRATNGGGDKLFVHLINIRPTGELSIVFPDSPSSSASILSAGETKCLPVVALEDPGKVDRYVAFVSARQLDSLWDLEGYSIPAWLTESSGSEERTSSSAGQSTLAVRAFSIRIEQ